MFDFIIIAIVCIVIIFLWRTNIKYYNRYFKIMDIFDKYLVLERIKKISIFQRVKVYEQNDIFVGCTSILTLKRAFDPFYYMFPNQESLILIGKIYKKLNTFIVKKNVKFSHLGIKFCKKQKGEFGNYNIYGNTACYEFVKKYNIDVFYITYIPKIYMRNCSYSTNFYLEFRNIKEVTESFYIDFISLMNNLESSSEKKIEGVKALYEKNLDGKITKLNIKQRNEERSYEEQKPVSAEVNMKRKMKKKTGVISKTVK